MLKKLLLFVSLLVVSSASFYFIQKKFSPKEVKVSLTYEDHINNFNRFKESGHYHQAYKAIVKAVSLKPKDKSLLWETSSIAQTLSKRSDSVAYAEKAWENGLKNREVLLRIYSLNKLKIQSNYGEQERLIQMANELEDPVKKVLTHGDLLIQFKQLDKAWDLWEYFFKDFPNAKVAQRIANCYIIKNDYQGAIEFLAQCYRNGILEEKGLVSYCRLYMIAGRYDAAESVLVESRMRYPQSANVLIEGAYAKFLMNQYDESLKILSQIDTLNLENDDNLMINRRLLAGNIYFAQKNFIELASLLDKLKSDDPRLEGESLLYQICTKPQMDSALTEEKIKRLLPKTALSRLLLIQYYHSRAEDKKLIDLANGLSDPVLKSSPLLTSLWASSLIKESQHVLAEQIIKRQFRKGVYSKAFFDQLASIYALNNKNDTLLRLAELKVKYFPKDKKSVNDLMTLYLQKKDFEKAEELLKLHESPFFTLQEMSLYEAFIHQRHEVILKDLKEGKLGSKRTESLSFLLLQNIELKDINEEAKQFWVKQGTNGLSLAYRYLYEGNTNEAYELFDQLKQNKDFEDEAKLGICLIHLHKNELALARKHYEELLNKELVSVNFEILKINFELIDKRGKEALALIAQLPLHYRSHKQITLLNIKALMLEGKWKQAIILFEHQADLCSMRREKILLAECYIGLGQYEFANEYIQDHDLLENSSSLICYFSVKEALKKQDLNKAKKLLLVNQDIAKDTKMVLAEVAVQLYEKKYDSVVESLDEYKTNNASAFYYWAEAQIHLGNFDLLEKQFHTSKKHANDILRLALLCESTDLFSEAAKLYEFHLPFSKQKAEIHNNIAWNLFLDGQYEAALISAKEAHDLSPYDYRILHTYTSILNANELYEKTVKILAPKNSIDLANKDPKTLYNLAESYRHLKRNQEALFSYRACLKSVQEGFGQVSSESMQKIETYIAQIEGVH
ncbi:hypothetical protein PQO01_14365 [Lentisphaera marina]|uniref:tetratricopeptide repeat protein n=1 Tax=Lentisphaera marina TaxID=1111041 RepID=UPI002366AAA6|nr:hypothetical protein [Lentisphaera marina]MDD7986132.1 hypothetical protein [Lentisphaera marina]